jgi:hypothetical protein
LSEGIDGKDGATSNRRASTGSTTTATPPAGWALVWGGMVISVLFTAQADSSAIATIAQIVRINVIVLPLMRRRRTRSEASGALMPCNEATFNL